MATTRDFNDCSAPELEIGPVRESELSALLDMIGELAEFEKCHELFANSYENLRDELFRRSPQLFADIARWSGEVAGHVVTYDTFSTFRGRREIYVEDLYVRSRFRGLGIGRSLMRHVAKKCLATGRACVQWRVLRNNDAAVDFYREIGATVTEDHMVCILSGEKLAALAESDIHDVPDLDPVARSTAD